MKNSICLIALSAFLVLPAYAEQHASVQFRGELLDQACDIQKSAPEKKCKPLQYYNEVFQSPNLSESALSAAAVKQHFDDVHATFYAASIQPAASRSALNIEISYK